MDKEQTQNKEAIPINFQVKMMNFFQQLRDDCHDFISSNFKQKSDSYESSNQQDNHNYQCKKVLKIQKDISEQQKNKQQKDVKVSKLKRPTSPFLLFYSENYHRIAQKYTGNPFKEMMKHVSLEWKDLNKEQQEPYIKRHERTRQQYQIDLQNEQQQLLLKPLNINILSQFNNESDLKSIGSLDSQSEISMTMNKSSD